MKLHDQLQQLIKHWEGKVTIKEGKNGALQLTFTKKYRCLNGEKREVVLEKIIGSHGFMTIEGDKDGHLYFSVPVKLDSMHSFSSLCNQLKHLEYNEHLLEVAN